MEEGAGQQSQKNDEQVKERAAVIRDHVQDHQSEFADGRRVMVFVDECVLHWDDVCGYGWGKRNERLTLPVPNPRQRQAFYGGLDARTGEMHLMAYPVAKSDNTADFLIELRSRYPEVKLTICWDNAGWHRGADLRAYLATVNDGLPPDQWPITCLNFAPHDSTQNPIEEVWRRGKLAIQKLRMTTTKFHTVIEEFERNLERAVFHFPARSRYHDPQLT